MKNISKTFANLFAILSMVFLSVFQLHAQLIINEVLYDPSNIGLEGDANGDGVYDQTQDEFIEFVNVGQTDLQIYKYRIFDKVKSTGLKTRRHTIIRATVPPMGALVVFGGGNPTGTFGGAIVRADSGTAGLSLGNTGEIIILEDSLGNVLDSLDTDVYSNNPDESYTRNPDATGAFVQHRTIPPAPGKFFSPGTKVNGEPFNTATFVLANQSGSKFICYPNPSKGKIFLSNNLSVQSASVYNANQQLVRSFGKVGHEIDLQNMPGGLYHVVFQTNEGLKHQNISIVK